jgi:hypothetical protein
MAEKLKEFVAGDKIYQGAIAEKRTAIKTDFRYAKHTKKHE